MDKQILYAIASILILVGLILIVFGLPDLTLIWQLGLGIVSLAMLLSFAIRWVSEKSDDTETAESNGH